MAERPKTDPTERSISAQMMTNVIPTAEMQISEIWRMMLIMLVSCRKLGVAREKMMQSPTSTARTPRSLNRAQPLRVLPKPDLSIVLI